jgi:hypothetical protein
MRIPLRRWSSWLAVLLATAPCSSTQDSGAVEATAERTALLQAWLTVRTTDASYQSFVPYRLAMQKDVDLAQAIGDSDVDEAMRSFKAPTLASAKGQTLLDAARRIRDRGLAHLALPWLLLLEQCLRGDARVQLLLVEAWGAPSPVRDPEQATAALGRLRTALALPAADAVAAGSGGDGTQLKALAAWLPELAGLAARPKEVATLLQELCTTYQDAVSAGEAPPTGRLRHLRSVALQAEFLQALHAGAGGEKDARWAPLAILTTVDPADPSPHLVRAVIAMSYGGDGKSEGLQVFERAYKRLPAEAAATLPSRASVRQRLRDLGLAEAATERGLEQLLDAVHEAASAKERALHYLPRRSYCVSREKALGNEVQNANERIKNLRATIEACRDKIKQLKLEPPDNGQRAAGIRANENAIKKYDDEIQQLKGKLGAVAAERRSIEAALARLDRIDTRR